MLKQLESLSLRAEGRYATTQELKFLKEFLPTVDLRLSAYRKIRDLEDQIIEQLHQTMCEIEPGIFMTQFGDVRATCRRDLKILLRSGATAMLIDDLDRLREDMLLWQKTITKAFQLKSIAALTHKTMPEIIEEYLSPEEFDLFKPVLQLNQAILVD